MNYKVKNRKLINADVISPEIVCAEFSDALIEGEAERMVNSMNHGHSMLMIYKEARDNLHISNVLDMLAQMEHVYAQWDEQDYQIRRKAKSC